jgi:hypothetical protein
VSTRFLEVSLVEATVVRLEAAAGARGIELEQLIVEVLCRAGADLGPEPEWAGQAPSSTPA